MSFLALVFPLALLVLGYPTFLVLLAACAATLLSANEVPAAAVPQNLLGGIFSPEWLALPCFAFAGELVARSVLDRRGRARGDGNTARPSILLLWSCAWSSAATGGSASALRATARFRRELLRSGESRSFVLTVTNLAVAAAPFVAPSVPLLVYAGVTREPSARICAAALPAAFAILSIGGIAWLWRARVRSRRTAASGSAVPPTDPTDHSAGLGTAGWKLAPQLAALLCLAAGTSSGLEAGALASTFAAVGAFTLERQPARAFFEAARGAATCSGRYLTAVAAGNVLAFLFSVNQIPAHAAALTAHLALPGWVLLGVAATGAVALGARLEPVSALLLCLPWLPPALRSVPLDTAQFGTAFLVALSAGSFARQAIRSAPRVNPRGWARPRVRT